MTCDMPCVSHIALYVISMHIVNSNSRSSSSNHWKLNVSSGKVEPAGADADGNNDARAAGGSDTDNGVGNKDNKKSTRFNNDFDNFSDSVHADPENISYKLPPKTASEPLHPSVDLLEDRMMEILTNKVVHGDEWIVLSPEGGDRDGAQVDKARRCRSGNQDDQRFTNEDKKERTAKGSKNSNVLSCGKKVNSTEYDHLQGVKERHKHTHIPEPDVAMVFQSVGKSSEVDMNELEQKLRKAKKDVERVGLEAQGESAAQLYNLIGNFWRIKGNTQASIECFRKALSISPKDSDILINLARVLFNLQYLKDAMFLARKSLQLQGDDQNSWLQHFTLGEILKAHGSIQEASAHFHQALDLNPGFQPAKSHLRDLHLLNGDPSSPPSVTHLTLFIILFLIIGVLFGVATSIDTNFQELSASDSSKLQQRHFNRAMAMRSIKMGFNKRLCRLRRNHNSASPGSS